MTPKVWYGRAAMEDPIYRDELRRILAAGRVPPLSTDPESPGHVVEFLKGGKSTCGVLLSKGGCSHRVLDVKGKEDHVDPAKVMDFSTAFVGAFQPRHELVEALRAIDREREQLKGGIDPYELWEVVHSEGQQWSLEELSDLYFSAEPGPHGKAALFRALEDGHAFCRQRRMFTPLKPELVARHKEEDRRAAEFDTRMHEAAAWLRRVADDQETTPPPDASQAVELLAAKVLFGARHPHAAEASRLATLAHFHSREAIFNTLVKLGHWTKDENIDLLRHQIAISFSERVIAGAEEAEWSDASRGAPRIWLRRVYSFTDGRGHHERAISIRPGVFGFTVGVHLASPALLLEPDGLVQKSAADRAATLHLPDRLIPMLPNAIREKAALADGARRPCLTLDLRFSWGFRLKGYRFQLRQVRVTRPLSIREANAAAGGDWGLRLLFGLARRLRQQRVDGGAVFLRKPEVAVRVRDGRIDLLRSDPEEPARWIEQELSILANTLAGRFCREHRIPALYRTAEPCPEVLVAPDRYDPVDCYRQERVLSRASLQTEPAAHHALGVEAYAPITQSWGRYPDLLMHQQICGYLTKGETHWSMESLKQALLFTANALENARAIESSARRYWLLRHLEGRIGETIDAVILDRFANGCLVELRETGLRTFCPIRPDVSLPVGTEVRVKLATVCPRANLLRLQLRQT